MSHIRRGVLLSCVLACTAGADARAQGDPSVYVYRVAGSDTLRLHVFRPAATDRGSRPAVLLYHGGGWSAGAPEWTFGTARGFVEQGLVAVSVQYRLSGLEWTPVDAFEDVCESVRWVRRNSHQLGIDSTRVAGYGVSAGGHLIASTATVGCPSSSSSERPVPDVLLLWSPALDVAGGGWFARQLRGKAEAVEVSPAHHVHAGTPPTSIVHGDKDTLTPLAGVRLYCERLRALGTECELNVYAGVGHLLTRNLANQESDFDPDPGARADGIEKHRAFLRVRGF